MTFDDMQSLLRVDNEALLLSKIELAFFHEHEFKSDEN